MSPDAQQDERTAPPYSKMQQGQFVPALILMLPSGNAGPDNLFDLCTGYGKADSIGEPATNDPVLACLSIPSLQLEIPL